MKSNKSKKTNSTKLIDLAQVFQKTVVAEKQKAQQQIEVAKQNDNASLLEKANVNSLLVHSSLVVSEDQPVVKPQVVVPVPIPLVEDHKIASISKEYQPLPVKEETLRFTGYLLSPEVDKIRDLRKFLIQRGVNLSVTDGQLARLAIRKLQLTEDLVELYLQVVSEDRRKHR